MDRPIIFTGENVIAIMTCAKCGTVTPEAKCPKCGSTKRRKTQTRRIIFKCPYDVVGDRLWVRETFGIFDVDADEDIAICYKADNSDAKWFKDKRRDFNELRLGKWRSPIHLPKWAARLWLEITGIRVERVQEINWEDVKDEGVQFVGDESRARQCFKALWNSIHGNGAWERNDWVRVIEFKVQ
jgi:hypothetical protein